MNIKMKAVSSQTFTITLSGIELIHLEGAADAFAQLNKGKAASWLGMYGDDYSFSCSKHVLNELGAMRDKVKLPGQ